MSPAAVREGVVLVPKQGPKSEEQSGARFRWREGDADEDEDADIWTPESSSSSPTVRNGNADNEDRKDGLRRDVDDPLITTRASPSPVLRGRDEREGAYWITLTVTQPTETYTTTVLLGDSYPSSMFFSLCLFLSCCAKSVFFCPLMISNLSLCFLILRKRERGFSSSRMIF
jgi:hypothetical protein